MIRAPLLALGWWALACEFPNYVAIDREASSPEAGAGGANGGGAIGGGANGGGAIGDISPGGVDAGGMSASANGGQQQAGDGSAMAGESGQAGAAPADLFQSTDLRGSCNGGIPIGEGSTEPVSKYAYDMTAFGTECGHHCGEDQGRFAYVEATGDFDVAVQVTGMDNLDAPRGSLGNPVKAGLMMRDALGPTARFVAILAVEPVVEFPDCFVFDYRSKPAGALGAGDFEYAWLNRNDAIFSRAFPNIWVRLVRVGNNVSGFASEDGDHWIPPSRSSYLTDFPTRVYLGIVASSAVEGGFNARSVTSFRNLRGFEPPTPAQ